MSYSDHWSVPSNPVALAPREIHVWRVRLDCDESLHQRLEATLSAEEIARANRFFFPRDRQCFIAARGILRTLLAGYLRLAPAHIDFTYRPQGKPYLLSTPSAPPISFNISHSHGVALLAFSQSRELGIDVERIRPDIACDEIARRYFAHREIAELHSLPPAQRPEAFFLCWTRKEAYMKALGQGLQMPLTSFRVSLTPGQPASLESADKDRWQLYSIAPFPNYAAALVAEGHDAHLQLLDWQPAY